MHCSPGRVRRPLPSAACPRCCRCRRYGQQQLLRAAAWQWHPDGPGRLARRTGVGPPRFTGKAGRSYAAAARAE
jgi:hypothetical protein